MNLLNTYKRSSHMSSYSKARKTKIYLSLDNLQEYLIDTLTLRKIQKNVSKTAIATMNAIISLVNLLLINNTHSIPDLQYPTKVFNRLKAGQTVEITSHKILLLSILSISRAALAMSVSKVYTTAYALIQQEFGGLMVDLDIVQTSNKSSLDPLSVQRITKMILDLIYAKTNLVMVKTHVAYIQKPKPIKINKKDVDKHDDEIKLSHGELHKSNGDESDGHGHGHDGHDHESDELVPDTYKDGIHILFPGLWLSKSDRKHIINHLNQSELFNTGLNLILDILIDSRVVDPASWYVPIFFVGHPSKNGAAPYKFKGISLYSRTVDGNWKRKDCDSSQVNVAYECSITMNVDRYTSEFFNVYGYSPIIKRTMYNIPSARILNKSTASNVTFDGLRRIYQNHILFLEILEIVANLPIEYYTAYGSLWKKMNNVLIAIKNARMLYLSIDSYKQLGLCFALQCSSYDVLKFLQHWNKITIVYSPTLARSNLMKYLQSAGPNIVMVVQSMFITTFINKNIIMDKLQLKTAGIINDTDFALILYRLIGYKYQVDNRGRGLWYLYISQPRAKNYMRWQLSDIKHCPASLHNYISKLLPLFIRKWAAAVRDLFIIKPLDSAEMKAQKCKVLRDAFGKEDVPDIDVRNLIDTIMTKIGKSLEGACNSKIILNITKRMRATILHLFFTNHFSAFSDVLDKDPFVRGYRGGLLKIRKGMCPLVISDGSKYAVSRGFPVNYKKFDPRDQNVRRVFKMIKNMFFDNDTSSMLYLLYYFSTLIDSDIKDQMFLLVLGSGSNGKSILVLLILEVIGNDYIKKLPNTFITCATRLTDKPSSNLMMLLYATLAWYSLLDSGISLYCSRIKELTGGLTLTGRQVYGTNRSFRPNCQHILCSNYSPLVMDIDNGIWRRLRVLTMRIKFVDKYDHRLDAIELRLKDPEVARWKDAELFQELRDALFSILTFYNFLFHHIMRSSMAYVANTAPQVRADTLAYKYSQNVIERFIGQCIYKAPTNDGSFDEEAELNWPISKLINKYNTWADINKIKLVTDIKGKFLKSTLQVYITLDLNGLYMVSNKIIVCVGKDDVPYGAKSLSNQPDLQSKLKPLSFLKFMRNITRRFDSYSDLWANDKLC